jgi:hypothetical protein
VLARLVVLAALAAVAVLVGLDVWSRQPIHAYHRSLPLGASMAASLVILMLVGFAAYELTPRVASLVPALTVLSSALFVIDLIQRLNQFHPDLPGRPLLEATVVSLLVLIDGKVFLLHRFGRRTERARDGAGAPRLLPSQERDVERLSHLVTTGDRESGQVIPIQGRWGEGKSFMLRCAKRLWDEDGRPDSPTMVIVDVWQQETEVDLQISIIEALLSHRRFLSGYRWLRIPTAFLFARSFAYLANSASTVKLKLLAGSSADVEADLKLPRLRWQPLFQRIVAANSATRRTVIALDEVDRATPAIAQAALTLARRSADVPGVTVLIPYIRPLMRYKAFNPLLPTLPDLASSMEAVLYEDALGRPAGAADTADPAARGSIHDWLKSVPPALAGAAAGAGAPAKDAAPRGEISDLLMRSYMSVPREHREMLVTKFEEKYLGPASLRLHQPNYDDVAAMLFTFSDLREIVQRLLREQSPNGDTAKRVEDYVKNGYEAWDSAVGIPPLRALHSALYSIFSAADEVAKSSVTYSDVDIATLAVVALDSAALRDLR